ncbi:hypothetical protein [Acidicapsa ligni]|uniref:hypothetical protein n=1 Tax=Acidicapsa ligni TaxID=542300 RepID=UPI0021E0E8FE|nr:hypothetical protein [Acidicapsa ligni]
MRQIRIRLKMAVVLAVAGILFAGRESRAQQPAKPTATFQVEFTNARLLPSHWVMKFGEDGNGWFDADPSHLTDAASHRIQVGEIHRAIQLSPAFTAQAFTVARQRQLFDFPCEGNLKVAFQGTKRLSYSGPEGTGSCEYNYSKDKQIQALGDSLLSVENTIVIGASLEMLLQHDRLGLDQAMSDLAINARNGNALEIGVIRETLGKIASDESVLERVRTRARLLLKATQ